MHISARLGAGLVVTDRAKDVEAARAKLDALLTEPRYAEAAGRIARKYHAFDPAEQVRRMVGRVEELIGRKRQADGPFDSLRSLRTGGQGARGKVFAG